MKFSQWTRLSQEHIPNFIICGWRTTPLWQTWQPGSTPLQLLLGCRHPLEEKWYQLTFTQMSMYFKCHRHLLTFKKTRRCAMHYGNYARKGKKGNILALTEQPSIIWKIAIWKQFITQYCWIMRCFTLLIWDDQSTIHQYYNLPHFSPLHSPQQCVNQENKTSFAPSIIQIICSKLKYFHNCIKITNRIYFTSPGESYIFIGYMVW